MVRHTPLPFHKHWNKCRVIYYLLWSQTSLYLIISHKNILHNRHLTLTSQHSILYKILNIGKVNYILCSAGKAREGATGFFFYIKYVSFLPHTSCKNNSQEYIVSSSKDLLLDPSSEKLILKRDWNCSLLRDKHLWQNNVLNWVEFAATSCQNPATSSMPVLNWFIADEVLKCIYM